MKPFPYLAALAASTLPFFPSTVQAAPKLLPFQGRLTDATGTPVADGAKVVQFKIYDAPTGGAAVWNGEVQKVTVNGGLVSTLLGSKADLSAVDFNQTLYLEITVDANADNQITAADPPLLPRQSILPAVFAVEAQQARSLKAGDGQAYDWSALFGAQSPATGKVSAARLADGSITNTQVAAGTITGDRLLAGTLTGAQIAPSTVSNANLADNSVTTSKIADGQVTGPKIAGNSITSAHLVDGAVLPLKMSPDCAVVTEEIAVNVNQPATAGWHPRDLNTIAKFPAVGGSISLTGHTITLQPGTYLIQAEAVARDCQRHRIILRNVTVPPSGTPTLEQAVIRGVGLYCETSDNETSTSTLKGIRTVAGSAESYELWHYVQAPSSAAASAFGLSTNDGLTNTYSQVLIIRLQ